MQITLMVPESSSGSLATPKSPSPIKRNYSPVGRVTSIASPRGTSAEIERRQQNLLREVSLRALTPKQSPVRDRSASDGFVLTQVKDIERRTPPKRESVETTPRKESTPRRTFVGISKLNSSEKQGRMLIPREKTEPLPPPIPRKDSVTMPPSSPKNEPLPALPNEARSNPTEATLTAIEPSFKLISSNKLAESKHRLDRTSSDRKIVDVPNRPPMDRGDTGSLRNIRAQISRVATPGSMLPKSSTTTKNLFEPFILSLNEVLCERYDKDTFLRKRDDRIIIINSENKIKWVTLESEPFLSSYIKKNSKSTFISILKKLKTASTTVQQGSELQSDILKNVDRLLENPKNQEHFSNNSDIRKRVNSLFFNIAYGKLYEDARLIKDMLKLSEYNIMQMYEFLTDVQEEQIKRFRALFPTLPTKPESINSIISALDHEELRGEMTDQEKRAHLEKIFAEPRALPISTPRVIEYSMETILNRTYKACNEFRKNAKSINDLNAVINAMPEQRKEGSLLSVTLPKAQARTLYDKYEIGACISVIFTPYSLALNNMIEVMPHAIRDLYRRTVKQLERQEKIHKIDAAKYIDVIRFQTRAINDQTVQWKLLTGTINEIVKYVPKKHISLPKRSTHRGK